MGTVQREISHYQVDRHSHCYRRHSHSRRSKCIVDSLSIDAAHEESIASEADCSEDYHLGGGPGDWEAVDPPFDEEEFEEGDEERVHHAYAEDDSVGVLHGGLHDGGVGDGGSGPLNKWRGTQQASEPRVRKVAVRIIFLTLMAPMLSGSLI